MDATALLRAFESFGLTNATRQSVEALVYGSIDAVNRLAFNIAVENFEDVAVLCGVTLKGVAPRRPLSCRRSRARAARGRSSSRPARLRFSSSQVRQYSIGAA